MMRRWLAILALVALSPLCQAQLVTVPIPGAPGLSVTVATGTAAQPLNVISGVPNAVNVTMGDDDHRAIPLQFTFPFFGQNFTQSWMHSNGVVSFQPPQTTGNFCCSGENLAATTNPALNYAIMPLWTDLIAQTGGSHWYLSRPNDMTYAWYNVNQYGTNNRSSFELKIDRQGLVDVRLQGALITGAPVTSGMTGNLSQGQYYQYYHGSNFSTQILQWSALGGTTAAPDPCAADPLSSPSCPNYASAYLTQQCTISALYDPSCPNYQQAYFTYQCSINPLYNQLCPGYAQAYYNQQCSLNPLYDRQCPGYTQAYYNQQCSLNPLYDSGCTGYAQAYYNQQCSLNPLYDKGCTGYAQAYYNQQCSINPLYDSGCTGYAQAYFDQQCSLNGLYDRKCPNYATAYATKMLLDQQRTTASTTTGTTPTAATTTVTTATVTPVQSDGTMTTAPSTTGNSTVDKTIAQPQATVSTASTPAAPVQLVAPATNSPAAPAAVATQSQNSQPQQTAQPQQSPQPTTRAQQLQQARVEAARREAASRGQQAQAQSKNAQSLDDQVAAQAGVITAMGYNAAFAAYENSVLRDVQFYRPHTIYPNQTTVDNQRALRGLTGASDRRHSELTDLQYR
jgi:hypothetical protein